MTEEDKLYFNILVIFIQIAIFFHKHNYFFNYFFIIIIR